MADADDEELLHKVKSWSLSIRSKQKSFGRCIEKAAERWRLVGHQVMQGRRSRTTTV